MDETHHSTDAISQLRAQFADHAPRIRPHRLTFTGSGREYFRVWIVNVLLSILTLGFYTPWARRRTAQYFYSHSLVAGSPLEFTAQQRRMVFGFVVVFVLTLAYQLAARTGQNLAVLAFLFGGAALAPFIWASAMRFRLSNTRWRGLRLEFLANWREIYRASWPVFAIALVWAVIFVALNVLHPEVEDTVKGLRKLLTPTTGALVLLGVVLSLLCFIRLEYNYRSLLVRRTRLGHAVGRWKPVYFDFVKIWLATALVMVLTLVLVGLTLAAVFGGLSVLMADKTKGLGLGLWVVVMFVVIAFAGVFALLFLSAPARAYREAKLFQLLWNNIGLGHIARFKCDLSTRRFVLLRLTNMLLTLLTLGFYRPFARVAEYRMKLESVTLHVKGGLEQVAGELVRAQQGGVGDAMADAVGLDLIG